MSKSLKKRARQRLTRTAHGVLTERGVARRQDGNKLGLRKRGLLIESTPQIVAEIEARALAK